MPALLWARAQFWGSLCESEFTERSIEEVDGALQIVGSHAARPDRIDAAEAERNFRSDVLAGHGEWPRFLRPLEGEQLFADRDALLGILRLLPTLVEGRDVAATLLDLRLGARRVRAGDRQRGGQEDDQRTPHGHRIGSAFPLAATASGRRR